MTGLFGRLHPLLLHFPIAFVLGAAAAEIAAIVTGREAWRSLGVVIARAGAVTAVATALAGRGHRGGLGAGGARLAPRAPLAARLSRRAVHGGCSGDRHCASGGPPR